MISSIISLISRCCRVTSSIPSQSLSRDVENADMSEADGALGVKQPSLIFAYVDSHELLVKEGEGQKDRVT